MLKAAAPIATFIVGIVLFGLAIAWQGVEPESARTTVCGSLGFFLILATFVGVSHLAAPHPAAWGLALFMMIPGIGGANDLIRGASQYRRQRETLSWPRTAGIVVSSRVSVHKLSGKGSELVWEVRYGYSAGGVAREADTITRDTRLLPQRDCCREEAQRRLEATYPAGRTVTVSYDPSRPGDAVLEPGPSRHVRWKLVEGTTLGGVGVLNLMLMALRLLRWRRERTADPGPRPGPRKYEAPSAPPEPLPRAPES